MNITAKSRNSVSMISIKIIIVRYLIKTILSTSTRNHVCYLIKFRYYSINMQIAIIHYLKKLKKYANITKKLILPPVYETIDNISKNQIKTKSLYHTRAFFYICKQRVTL